MYTRRTHVLLTEHILHLQVHVAHGRRRLQVAPIPGLTSDGFGFSTLVDVSSTREPVDRREFELFGEDSEVVDGVECLVSFGGFGDAVGVSETREGRHEEV